VPGTIACVWPARATVARVEPSDPDDWFAEADSQTSSTRQIVALAAAGVFGGGGAKAPTLPGVTTRPRAQVPTAPTTAPTPLPAPTAALKPGDSRDQVTILQRALTRDCFRRGNWRLRTGCATGDGANLLPVTPDPR
jgi:hypothetical protein